MPPVSPSFVTALLQPTQLLLNPSKALSGRHLTPPYPANKEKGQLRAELPWLTTERLRVDYGM